MTGPLGLRTVAQCERALLAGLQGVLHSGDLNPIRDALYEMAAQDPDRTRRYLEKLQTVAAAPTALMDLHQQAG